MKAARQAAKKGIKSAIETALSLNAITAPVISNAVEGQDFPFVVLGASTEVPAGDKTSDTSNMTATIVSFSASIDEAETIASVIQENLTSATKIALDAPFTVISQDLDIGLETITDTAPEGEYFAAPIRLRYLIEH